MRANLNLFDGLALNIVQRFGSWPTGRVLLVTSARPAEGKTFVARRLAKTLTGMVEGRVMLIDANAENPSLAGNFDANGGGDLFDCLAAGKLLQTSIQATLVPGLFAMPAERSSSRGRFLYRSEAINRVLDGLRASFALTILDASSLANVGSLALRADATLVVVDANRTRRDVVKGALDSPHVDRSKIMGVVLNKRPEYVPRWLYRSML